MTQLKATEPSMGGTTIAQEVTTEGEATPEEEDKVEPKDRETWRTKGKEALEEIKTNKKATHPSGTTSLEGSKIFEMKANIEDEKHQPDKGTKP